MAFEVHYAAADQVIVSDGPLVVRLVEGARTDFIDIDRVLGVFEQRLATHDHVGVLIVVHHGAPVPSPYVLRYMAKSGVEVGRRGTIVFVLLGLGFWAMSAHRSVEVLARLVGFDVPVEVQIEAAAERLAAVPGLSADAILRTYESAAQRLTAKPLMHA